MQKTRQGGEKSGESVLQSACNMIKRLSERSDKGIGIAVIPPSDYRARRTLRLVRVFGPRAGNRCRFSQRAHWVNTFSGKSFISPRRPLSLKEVHYLGRSL